MALTAEQQKVRENRMTASRVGTLMNGAPEKIHALWEEMVGLREPDDLTWEWAPYLGTHTEELHLNWLQHVFEAPITRRGESVIHPEHDWAACTLDGWRDAGFEFGPVEVKHVGGFEDISKVRARYFPQVQWQMACCDTSIAWLSIIEGARKPACEPVHRDPDYIYEMFVRADAFMQCVFDLREPVDLPAVAAPVIPEQYQTVDLAGNNLPNWADYMGNHLRRWSETLQAANEHKNAKEEIKDLLPADVGKVIGSPFGIVTRSKSGAVSIREVKA